MIKTTNHTNCQSCGDVIGQGVVKKAIEGLCGFCYREREIAKLPSRKDRNPECSNPNHGFFISNGVLCSCAHRT